MVVVDPASTPKGCGLRILDTDPEKLWAFTDCCEANIHFDTKTQPFCSRCLRRLYDSNSDFSSYCYLDQSSSFLRAWVAHWTGFNKDDIEVHIKS